MRNKESLETGYTKLTKSFLDLLVKLDFLNEVKTFKEKGSKGGFKMVNIGLNGKKNILDIKRISKLSRRMYINVADLKSKYRSVNETVILTTPKGILTKSEAIKNNTAGELLCKIVH